MAEPKIAGKKPMQVTLEPGTYAWCSCGESKDQPFCDGSHQGTEFKPVVVKVEERKDAWLCTCKRTDNKPYCDGTHNSL